MCTASKAGGEKKHTRLLFVILLFRIKGSVDPLQNENCDVLYNFVVAVEIALQCKVATTE